MALNGTNGHGIITDLTYTDDLMDEIGDAHAASSIETPMRDDAFELSDDEKVARIQGKFKEIMDILGMDMTDDSLKGTPRRVAKMFVKEIFSGLDPEKKPAITLFDNKYRYDEMLVEKNITVQSFCEHHFLPIYGKAHIAYISSGKVIGLSKLNRVVEYYSRRPQVQERLTVQIAEELKKVLKTDDVAVFIEAKHMCVQARGVEHHGCTTVTMEYGGKFKRSSQLRNEFIAAIQSGGEHTI